ncbi:MAG: DedA family protein [Acidobacteria bacterium]|nr:DedA family protein [Acidobacteriota bacterium]
MLIEDLIREYGLWAVFFGVMIEGDLTLLFAGVLAHYGLFSFGEALLVSTLGGFVGDCLSYLVGYRGKEWIKHRNFYQRAQPRLEKLCARFGLYSIFLVKYVYGLRTASAVFWGFAHMRLRRFLPLTLASCAAWALVLIGLGFTFSGAIGVIIGRVQQAGMLLLVAFGIAIAIALILYLVEVFVVGRRVPEMEPIEPPRIHERLHERFHETFQEAIDTVRKDPVKEFTEEDKTIKDRLPPEQHRSRQIGSHRI